MISRPWQIWLVFVVCLLAVTTAVGWLSWRALAADRAEEQVRREAALDSQAALALWRMDSVAAVILALENTRGAIFGMEPRLKKAPAPLVMAYFQLDRAGNLSSDQEQKEDPFAENEDQDNLRARIESSPTTQSIIDLRTHVGTLLAQFGVPELPHDASPAKSAMEHGKEPPDSTVQQMAQAANEYEARKRSVEANVQASNQLNLGGQERTEDWVGKYPSPLVPLWVGNQLVLARRAADSAGLAVEGCVLNWSKLRSQLLDQVQDLLPGAALEPVHDVATAPPGRLLASLPVQLIPGTLPATTLSGLSPIQWSLFVTWSAMALAIAAVALLLSGVISLSERRAAFVSAVTHELRTPLTTFRMYAEMLSENMVPDEADRRRYLETLRVEADRLTHLVANVLAYARLERGRAAGNIESVTVARLLKVATQRLADRAAQSGLNLSTEVDGDTQQAEARADPSAVEQILFNLVDNACKYAAGATDRTLHLSAAVENGAVQIRLRDHGPGVSPTEERRLFQPFRKSARDAAQSAPGVGLGLALCRRLAREMGGELRYEPGPAGASFVLTLPKA